MTAKSNTSGLRTWIELDRSAIKHNFAQFRTLIPKKTKLCAVVKSNAYGHSLIDFSKEIIKSGADWLAVDSAIEGIHLREQGIKVPILVLGYTLPEKMQEAVDADLSLSISNFESLQEILKISDAKIHIKVDTGMHRQGFMLSDASKLLKILSGAKNSLEVEGLFTHFAADKNPSFLTRTREQLEEFKEWIQLFKGAKFDPIIHAARTSSAILLPEAHFDMVRIGIGLYGLWPSKETKAFAEEKMPLKPVLSWKTIVGEVKVLKDGGGVGYDFTETLPKNSKIAILPIGYWHGFPWQLSSIGKVSVNGVVCKVVGRVSMDMICIDVTDLKDIRVGAEVVIISNNTKQGPMVTDIAGLLDTSWYEVITRLNPLIKRIFV